MQSPFQWGHKLVQYHLVPFALWQIGEQKFNNRQDWFFFSAPWFPLQSLCVVQTEWLISEWEIPPKWHARNTLQLYFTTDDTDNPCRHWREFTEKQKTDKPIIVLTDLPYCYQCLQVLIGLVRVDVVQRAAVPGVSIGGCEVNGNLVERITKCTISEQYARIS